MDWADERYVRLYTRDTTDWNAMGWQARALLPLILRKVDRAGVLELGKHGVRGLAGHVQMPLEHVDPGLDDLLADGCVELSGGQTLIVRNFIEAQGAAQSDRVRQEESRRRRRASARTAPTVGVTNRDNESRGVTNRDNESRGVTNSHERTQAVTDCHSVSLLAVPSCAVPDCADPDKSNVGQPSAAPTALVLPLVLDSSRPAEPKAVTARVAAEAWLEWFNRIYRRRYTANPELLRDVQALLARGFTEYQMRAVAAHLAKRWEGDPEMSKFVRPSTLLKPSKFAERLDEAKAAYPKADPARIAEGAV